MATLQKFKHFTIQCGESQQSPTRSPAVHLRRRKTTLRMLLSRRRRLCRESSIRRESLLSEKQKSEDRVRRHSLKDLFKSTPPGAEDVDTHDISIESAKSDVSGSGRGPDSPKQAWTGFRYKSLLSKKAWRPILLSTITE